MSSTYAMEIGNPRLIGLQCIICTHMSHLQSHFANNMFYVLKQSIFNQTKGN
jgi:hypothetical protein